MYLIAFARILYYNTALYSLYLTRSYTRSFIVAADIDIDVTSKLKPHTILPECIYASRIQNNEIVKHPVGAYFQNIPIDPISKLAAIPYQNADDYGYFKIDLLHLTILDMFDNKNQIKILLKKEPDWELLMDPDVVNKLFQLSKHFDIVYRMKPKSINDIADCIAIIRPGKRILLNRYIHNKQQTRALLYKVENSSDYKKSHAIAYAHIVVLQLHLIKQDLL